MRDVRDIKWIGEGTLRRYYDQLYFFYQRVWAQPHEYIIFNARRCFNLNYVFWKVYESEAGAVASADRFLSNNAILLYSQELAREYAVRKRFPSILIVDDLVLHGRGLAKLLSELERLIFAALPVSPDEMNQDERYYVRRSLASSVDIINFAANNQPLLIEDIYLQKLQSEQWLYTRTIRSLSQRISSFLQKVDVPNTSYAPSCRVSEIPEPPRGWVSQSWSYRGIKQNMYFKPPMQSKEVNHLPTIRLRRPASSGEQHSVWLTSLPLFGELTADQLSRICQRISGELEPSVFPWLCFILRQEHPLLQKQRAQLVTLLLSMGYLLDFLYGIAESPDFSLIDGSDLDKIAQNFGKASVVLPELRKIAERLELSENLQTILRQSLRGYSAPFLHNPVLLPSEEADRGAVNASLEYIFYDVGMGSEQAAHRAISSNQYQPGSRDSGIVPLEDLFLWKKPVLRFDQSGFSARELQKISCMLALMDNGLMSMNIECAERSGGSVVGSILKAGELATFSLPRRLHLVIPALALVERDCWRLNLDSQSAVARFIQSLPDTARPGPKAVQKKEQAVLSFLKSQGGSFVELLYDCGQTLNGWDIDLITSDDWAEEGGSCGYLAFIQQEAAGQNFYLELAKQFLSRAQPSV